MSSEEHVSPTAPLKKTTATRFFIDFDYLKNRDANWRSLLSNYLCEEHKVAANDSIENLIDSIDPETGQITRNDLISDILFSHCAKDADFIQQNGALTDSIFRLFLTNNNRPMNSLEIGDELNRSAEIVLKTISGPRIYNGIKPYQK